MQFSKNRILRALALPTAILAFASAAHADYSGDPGLPALFQATGFDDVQAKVVAGPDGGHYVSCLTGAGYDVAVMRVDRNGRPMWKSVWVIAEDRALSSTVDYGLASDALGNAYVAYEGRTAAGVPSSEVTAISPAGTILWNAVVDQSATASIGPAHVTVASDGFVWAAHLQDATTRVQRLDPATGAQSFAAPVVISETGQNQWLADIQPSINGAVIVSTVRQAGFTSAKLLRAHRINVDGTRPWVAAGVPVFTTSSLQFGNFPYFISDGQGGAYFTWYTTGPLQSWVQRIDQNGTPLYGTNGVAVTSTSTFERTDPSMTLGTDGRLYVFWTQHQANTSNYGIYGQCFAKGVRQWGNDGAAVEAMATVAYSRSFARAMRLGDNVACSYNDSTSAVQDFLRCASLNPSGTILSRKDIATNTGNKSRYAMADAVMNGSVVFWQGALSTGASDIWGARVNSDGTIGVPPPVYGDLDGDGLVNARDITVLLSQWGGPGSADLIADGIVGPQDLAALLTAWTG